MSFNNYRFSFFNVKEGEDPAVNTVLLEDHNITFQCSRGINFSYGPNQKVATNLLVFTSTSAEDDLLINSLYNAILNMAINYKTVYMTFEQINDNNEVGFSLSKILLTDVRAMFSDSIVEDVNTNRSFISNLHIGFEDD